MSGFAQAKHCEKHNQRDKHCLCKIFLSVLVYVFARWREQFSLAQLSSTLVEVGVPRVFEGVVQRAQESCKRVMSNVRKESFTVKLS